MNRGHGRKAKALCKKCHSKQTTERQKKNRAEYIAYKGGKCARCDYDECHAAMEFHHIDPAEKDPNFASMRSWGFERAKSELDKCILLCSNCHRSLHEKTWGIGEIGITLPLQGRIRGSIPLSSTKEPSCRTCVDEIHCGSFGLLPQRNYRCYQQRRRQNW